MVGLLSLPTREDGTTELPTVNADLLERAPSLGMAEFFPGALEARPDYLLAAERVNQAGVRTAAARNERLPQLDLHFSYGLHGLAGDYSSAYDRVWTGDEPQWGAGLSLTVPMSRRESRAKMQAANVYERQAELRVEQLRQRISLEVENAVRRLDVLDQRLETARSSVNFAAEGLKLEEARLEKGQTSGFAVSEMQRRLADAQTRELAARVDLTKAVTELWSVSGQLLTRYQIEVLREQPEEKGINWMAPFDAMMKN
jgi:outer membrane protein TolC